MPKRHLLLFVFLLAVVIPILIPVKHLQANSVELDQISPTKTFPNFDIRSANYLSQPMSDGILVNNGENTWQKNLIKDNRQNLQIRWRPTNQTPHSMFSYTEALTPPSQQPLEQIINSFLKENQELYSLNLEQNQLKEVFNSKTQHNGMQNVVLQQYYQDLPVLGAQLQVVLNRDGQIVLANSELVPKIDPSSDLSLIVSPQEAINLAADSIQSSPSLMFDNAPSPKLVLFPMASNHKSYLNKRKQLTGNYVQELRPAWQVPIFNKQGEKYLIFIDGQKGEVLLRTNLTWHFDGQTPSYRVFTSNTPQPNLPFVSINPPYVERQLVTTNGDKTASPNGWLDASNPVTTKGNNVDAQIDRDGKDSGNGFRPTTTNSAFDFPLMLNTAGQEPEQFSSASVTSLFYWCNFAHDYLYKLGFDESAGNFQVDNFGRGGMSGDPVIAEAQDGSGFNNASFGSSEDGFSGRMQIFLWKTATPKIDASYDAEVIVHEYVHGLTTRLVGGPQNVISLLGPQSAAMGEGWSDWYAMSVLSKPGDDPRASYPYGSYVTRKFNQGIRRFPYSTDIKVNPVTFADIDPTQSRFTKDVTEIHNVGEIWCQALWEVRANFIDAYGFERGKQMVEQLVTDALKITPINPSMIDGRDAILLADQISNSSVNQCLIWQGFAKRGIGFSASSLGATNQVKQAFDLPPYCQKTGTLSLNLPTYLDGETIQIRLGDADLMGQPSIKVIASSQKTGDQEEVLLAKDNNIPGLFLGTVKVSLAASSSNDGTLQSSVGDTIQITYQDASNDQGQAVQTMATARILKLKNLLEDSLEKGIANFTPDTNWGLTTAFSHSPSHSFTDSPNGNYKNRANAMIKVKKVNLAGLLGSRLVFWQRYQMERGFDFGFVEVKLPDQAWQTVAAFSGEQTEFKQTTIDLSKFDGQKLRVRFRLVTDGGNTADGWYIDDVQILSGTTN